jgi:hypothetical protein
MSNKMTLLNAVLVAALGFASAGAASAANANENTGTSSAVTEGGEAKDFGCGAKGQKACPLQGWMKSVMQSAVTSGEGAKLASALELVAAKAPPGMPQWGAISKEGAAKAKSGDIDGAKASCKSCHDLYKADYKAKLRDRAF